jgi:hypothetical protein
MLSFRSILFAAAAFATIASAIPTPGTPTDAADMTDDPLAGIPARIDDLTNTEVTDLLGVRGGSSNPVDLISNCHDSISVIVVKLSQYSFSFLQYLS